MCGFIAAQLRDPWLTPKHLHQGLDSIVHRGPDGAGKWFSKDRKTVLGHVRLSIIGVNNGEQPLGTSGSKLKAVVNGEFYGYQDIRAKLKRSGAKFQTESDSEIALHLYQQYGLSFPRHLKGEFALVIADQSSGDLIAARDRFGIKPLFYARINGDIIFASEIKALFALGIDARWDHSAMMSELTGLRRTKSLFQNIHQVPPGSIAIAKNGEVRVFPYWKNAYATASELEGDDRSEQDLVRGFRETLDQAIADRLVADVEVGCYLSGGLDSSAVLGLAQAQASKPIRAFTIAFDGAFDESQIAERTARHVGSSYDTVRVRPQDLADAFEQTIWHCEKPIFNANSVAKFLLSRKVREAGIKVVLTGEGADEVLAGYPMERLDNLKFGRHLRAQAERDAAIDRLLEENELSKPIMFPEGSPLPGTERLTDALGFCPTWIRNLSIIVNSLTGLMDDAFKSQETLGAPYAALLSDPFFVAELSGRDPVNVSLRLWQETMLPNFILTVLSDRMEMAHSVEGRVPFLDDKVASFAAGLPVHYKIRERTEKYILREAAKDVLTSELYERHKHPFIAPPADLTGENRRADPLAEVCQELVRSKAFEDQPFFDVKKTIAWLDNVSKPRWQEGGPASPDLLRLASLASMQSQFNPLA
ncbi:MAG: asparagine synthase (glutamine-hydrolyzing) [Pseudomonadota bacterium]